MIRANHDTTDILILHLFNKRIKVTGLVSPTLYKLFTENTFTIYQLFITEQFHDVVYDHDDTLFCIQV